MIGYVINKVTMKSKQEDGPSEPYGDGCRSCVAPMVKSLVWGRLSLLCRPHGKISVPSNAVIVHIVRYLR